MGFLFFLLPIIPVSFPLGIAFHMTEGEILISNFSQQPFSWTAGVLFLAAGAGLIFYFRYEKARMERKRVAEAAKGVGRPKVGGPFELVNHKGEKFGSEDMRGKYSLVCFYFYTSRDVLEKWRGK